MYRIIKGALLLIFTLSITPVYGITIVNKDIYPISYTISDSSSCILDYSDGNLGPGGSVFWTQDSHPNKVCVIAAGVSSILGAYATNLKNEGCTIEVYDAGFMRGVKIRKISGC